MLSGGEKQSLAVPASSLFYCNSQCKAGLLFFFSDWEDTFNFYIQAKLSDEYQHNKSNQKRKVKLPVFYQSTVIAAKTFKREQQSNSENQHMK